MIINDINIIKDPGRILSYRVINFILLKHKEFLWGISEA